jgi:hypothetical protein
MSGGFTALRALVRALFGASQPGPLTVASPVLQTRPALLAGAGPHGFMGIVGESHYQPALHALRRQSRQDGCEADGLEFTATLKPEPDNPVDPNAIIVLGPDGQTFGHLNRDVAKRYQRQVVILGPLTCAAELCGGDRDRPSIGVVLHWTAVGDQLKTIKVPRLPTQKEA